MDANTTLIVTESGASINVTDVEASSSLIRPRKRFSKVWLHFTEKHMEDGNKRVVCNYCSASFACSKKKYWSEIENSTLLFAIATVLDPRYKLMFVTCVFTELYGHEASLYITRVKQGLYDIFDAYSCQFASSRTNEGNLDMQENEERIAEVNEEVDILSVFDQFLHSQVLLQDSKSELDQYLEESVISRNQTSFTILSWWKDNVVKYPMLSKIARDILAIPASTVASESAFSTSGRIIDQYRSSLCPETVKTLICSRDWLRGGMAELALCSDN